MASSSAAGVDGDFDEALRISWQQLEPSVHRMPWESGVVGFALGRLSFLQLVMPNAGISLQRPAAVPVVPTSSLAVYGHPEGRGSGEPGVSKRPRLAL